MIRSGQAVIVLKVEDAGADVGVLALADFAFAVKVPVRGTEGFENVRACGGKGVVDVMRGDDVRFAAREGARDAEEANEVGIVGVEELSIWEILLTRGLC